MRDANEASVALESILENETYSFSSPDQLLSMEPSDKLFWSESSLQRQNTTYYL